MWKIVLENLIPILFTIITPVLLVLVNGLIKAAAKKWHLDWALNYETKIDELVIAGIKAVEKKSLSAVKSGGPKTSGEQKLKDVIDFVNAQLKANTLPEKAGAELSMLVESKLFDGVEKKIGSIPLPSPPPLAPASK